MRLDKEVLCRPVITIGVATTTKSMIAAMAERAGAVAPAERAGAVAPVERAPAERAMVQGTGVRGSPPGGTPAGARGATSVRTNASSSKCATT